MGWTTPRRSALVAAAALLVSACGSGRPANRFIRYSGPGPIELMDGPAFDRVSATDAQIRTAVEKARAERPQRTAAIPTVEGSDDILRQALSGVEAEPSAGAHVRVAQAYARLRVYDLAIDHFDRAIRLDPRAAAAFDGRARIWRDWHMPGLAIGDAHRATHFAPRSPIAHNTLGTVLLSMGACDAARAAFERALHLEPGVAYATRNLAHLRRRRSRTPNGCTDNARTTTPVTAGAR